MYHVTYIDEIPVKKYLWCCNKPQAFSVGLFLMGVGVYYCKKSKLL